MKAKEISKLHGLKNASFESWLKSSNYVYKSGVMGGLDVDERENIDEIVGEFKQFCADEQTAAQQAKSEQDAAAQQKSEALAKMLITSGYSFDGYTVTKYSGYISGDDAVQIDRGRQGVFARATNVGESLMESLVHIRRNALAELKESAYALGCNAVIGVDFDYLTLDPETVNVQGGTLYLPYVFGVTANGNAVVIEKD